tara:strand:- start:270 stop:536 length:267 start_codon:yes stop_codon:yes gene_type:complete
MEKVLGLAIIITVLFGIMKFVEMKFLEKKMKPLKELVRDLCMVFLASFSSSFVFINYQNKIDDFFSVITNENTVKAETTQVFTGMPEF